MRKSSIVVAAFAVFALTLPTAALAKDGGNSGKDGESEAPYGTAKAAVTTSGAVPEAGGPLTLTATGFCPGEAVIFTIGFDNVGKAEADKTGTATLVLAKYVPDKNHTVVATSKKDDRCSATATTELVVTKAAVPIAPPDQFASSAVLAITPAANLPVTGNDASSPLQLGGMAILAGAGLVGVSTFRRRTSNRVRTSAS